MRFNVIYYIEILLKANQFLLFVVGLLRHKWIWNQSLRLHPFCLFCQVHLWPVLRSELLPVLSGDLEKHCLLFCGFWLCCFHVAKGEKMNILNARHILCLFVVVFVYYSWRFLSFSHIWSEEKSIQSRAHFFEQNNHLSFSWSHSWLWSSVLMFILQYLQ